MKNTIFAIMKVAVTVLLFLYIFRRIDFHQFIATMRSARLDILAFGFIVLWLGHYVCIFRWRILMRPLMPVPSLTNLFGIYCIGLFFNIAFPGLIGGDVVKMYYAGKPSKSYPQSFAATFLDRDAGMLAMMIIACTMIIVHPVHVSGIPVTIIIWSVFVAFILVNIAIFAPACHRRLTDLLIFLKLPKFAHKIDLISGAFQLSGKHPAGLLISLLISLVNQLLVIALTWILALGLHIQAPLAICMVFVPVITLISMIPISLGGVGLREYATMSLFGSIGVPLASCIALGLLSSIVTILSSLPGGIVYILFKNKGDAQHMAQFETEFS
jgi:glycosyltransferase 2 family protein